MDYLLGKNKTEGINQLQEIVREHNSKPMIVRQSWLKLNPADQEIAVVNTVSDSLNNGHEIFAQIIPEWCNCSIDTMDCEGYEWCEECLVTEFYDEMDRPADVFKADWKLIFVDHDWKSGVETISENLHDLI